MSCPERAGAGWCHGLDLMHCVRGCRQGPRRRERGWEGAAAEELSRGALPRSPQAAAQASSRASRRPGAQLELGPGHSMLKLGHTVLE